MRIVLAAELFHNLAYSMTKARVSSPLKTLINTNYMNFDITKQIEQVGVKQANIGI